MGNINVFKTVGRYVTAQINAFTHSIQAADQTDRSSMCLENRLIVQAWNALADHDCNNTANA